MLLERKILWFTFVSVFTIATDATQNLQARLCCRCLRIALPPPNVTVHILHDDTLTQDNRDKFSYIAGRYGQLIKFYNVEKICAAEIEKISKLFANYPTFIRFSIGAICRLLSFKLFPEKIEKIIYLDSDIIVTLDINELWQISIGDKPLAAVAESGYFGRDTKNFFGLCKDGYVKSEDYFNSGVLFINLKQLRQNEMQRLDEGMKFLADNPRYHYFDQEILNYCFSKNYLKLPKKFNDLVLNCKMCRDFKTDGRICHYAGNIVLSSDMRDDFNRLWFKYFSMTPWFNDEVIAHLDEEVRKINAENKRFTIKMTAQMSGKVRAFFTAASNVDVLKQIFLIRDGEEIISLVNQESFQTLAKSMAESRGKKLFFILFNGYNQLRDELIKLDFVEGQDFLNAEMFLSDANGVPLNTYQLVKSL